VDCVFVDMPRSLLALVSFGVLWSQAVPVSEEPAALQVSLDREIVHGDTGEQLDELVTLYSSWGFSGTVLVARGPEILLHKGYGFADLAQQVRNGTETRHPSLSVTKPILATAVLRLAESGVLDLDAPLSTYLGEFPESKTDATLHHLLTHTAGLAVRGSDVGRPDRASFIEAMKEAPFESAPGQQRRYSNAGYSLVAAVVEEATGKRWQEVVREEVFAPAGMSDSAFATDEDAPPTAFGYAGTVHTPRALTLADGPPEMAELWWGAAGAAGIDGTVADLYRWQRSMTSGGLITAASADRAFTAYIEDQGYGWHVDTTEEGTPRRWKGGGLPMYESKVAWYPDRDLVIVFAINNHFGWRVPLWNGLERILFGAEIDLPPRPTLRATGASAMAGSYQLSDGGKIEIRADPNWVLVEAGDEPAARALGFEDRQAAPGATLAMLETAPATLTGLHLHAGRPDLRGTEIRYVEAEGANDTLLLAVDGHPTASASRISEPAAVGNATAPAR
jgi:CubicO group peptidase (beta-lactamase class C family)